MDDRKTTSKNEQENTITPKAEVEEQEEEFSPLTRKAFIVACAAQMLSLPVITYFVVKERRDEVSRLAPQVDAALRERGEPVATGGYKGTAYKYPPTYPGIFPLREDPCSKSGYAYRSFNLVKDKKDGRLVVMRACSDLEKGVRIDTVSPPDESPTMARARFFMRDIMTTKPRGR